MSRTQNSGWFARRFIEALEGRRLLALAGTLDTSFSGDGKATIDLGGLFTMTANDVAVQADGKTVVVGFATPASDDFQVAVARFNLDGTPDTSFGTNGITQFNIGNANFDTGQCVAIQGDGKIVVGAESEVAGTLGSQIHFGIARLNPNGKLDTSFRDTGKRTIDFGGIGGDSVRDIIIQQIGTINGIVEKILVVGTHDDTTFFGTNDNFAVARLNPDGLLDADFDGDGKAQFGFNGQDSAEAVALDSQRRIVIAGTTDSVGGRTALALQRLIGATGAKDTTFGPDGQVVQFPDRQDFQTHDLLIQGGDKIVVAGTWVDRINTAIDAFAITRLLPSGQPDTSFGGSGTGLVRTDFGGEDDAFGIIRSADGGLVAAGTSSGKFALAGYTADGVLKSSFGTGGKVVTDFGTSGQAFSVGLAKGPGRRFVVAGGTHFKTARYLDVGANVVHATAFGDPSGSEQGIDQASFFVFREERLPFATRVYFSIGGTAKFSPTFGSDYQLSGMTVPTFGTLNAPYVDIPANQTFTLVTLAPIDDTLVEGTETATFTIRPSIFSTASYEIGAPSSAELTIFDNDVRLTAQLGTGVLTPSSAELPANGKITYSLQWTVPQGRVWRDLDTLEFRIVHEGIAVAWIRWEETTNAISLRDPVTGLFTESGQPGSNHNLKAGNVQLDLRHTTVVGSGPTGQSVTLGLALKLKEPHGVKGPLTYRVEAFASDDDGNKQGFDEIGTLSIL